MFALVEPPRADAAARSVNIRLQLMARATRALLTQAEPAAAAPSCPPRQRRVRLARATRAAAPAARSCGRPGAHAPRRVQRRSPHPTAGARREEGRARVPF